MLGFATVRAAALATFAIVLVASCSANVLVGVDPCSPDTATCGLVHRYTFDGVGTTVLDSVGGAHGTVVGASLSGHGTLTLVGLTGADIQYVVLPHGLLRQLHDATFEAWINWAGSAAHDGTRTAWQRIFDFGEGTSGIEGEQASKGDALSYVFVTPQSAPRTAGEVPSTRVAYQVPHDPQSSSLETVVNASPLHIDVDTQVGVVIDSGAQRMSLFVNGAIVGSTALAQSDPLSYVYDVNDWLGRSQFSSDGGFSGTYLDFRIYSIALTDDRIRASYDAGPDRVP
ncbi:MAG TPA: LamG-like jellyroll fold domain-containing protein [Polyangia bacterium]|nr:LamG-like jellyroll fold domain-containing protein [Polyangia bacterium]